MLDRDESNTRMIEDVIIFMMQHIHREDVYSRPLISPTAYFFLLVSMLVHLPLRCIV